MKSRYLKIAAGAAALMLSSTSPTLMAEEKTMDELWGGRAEGSQATEKAANYYMDSKYAMFIHWGLYSQPAGVWKSKTYYGISEWIMKMANIPVDEYKELAKTFNPTGFDADEWVQLAKDAGMKYIVITAKHHDGFAMYDSKVSDFDIVDATPFGRDPIAELAEACKREGIGLGFYYSQFQDWSEPHGGASSVKLPEGEERDFNKYYNEKVVPQVTELLTQYGDVVLLWFDTPGPLSREQSQQLCDLVKKYQPDCLVNSRVGNGLGDYSTLGDMQIPAVSKDGLWETVDTTNNSWAYASYDHDWKSPQTILQNLTRVVARGGNYMLNIGPKGDGTVPAVPAGNLRKVGAWLQAHGEGIYKTRASVFPTFAWGDSTIKGNDLYLQLFDWPKSGQLTVAGIDGQVASAVLQTNPGSGAIDFAQDGDVITLKLPKTPTDELMGLVKLGFDAPVQGEGQLVVDGDFPTYLKADFANTNGVVAKKHQWNLRFGEWHHLVGLTDWDEGGSAEWTVRVLEPGRYMVRAEYSCAEKHKHGDWQVDAGDKQVVFGSVETGHRFTKPDKVGIPQYKVKNVGVVDFTETGFQTIRLTNLNDKEKGKTIFSKLIIEPYL